MINVQNRVSRNEKPDIFPFKSTLNLLENKANHCKIVYDIHTEFLLLNRLKTNHLIQLNMLL